MSSPTAASAIVATKVFAIPELLEHILLAVVNDKEGDDDYEYDEHDEPYEPAYALFRALRVNHSFKNTINGSAKLQRLMFLRFRSTSGDTTTGLNSPVLWLLGELGMDQISVTFDYIHSKRRLAPYYGIELCDRDVDDGESQYRGLQLDYSIFRTRYGAPEASWRNMLVARESDAGSTVVEFSVNLGCYDGLDRLQEPVFSDSATIAWEFKADEKLEAVLRRYEGLMQALEAKEKGIADMDYRRWKERREDKILLSDWANDLQKLSD